MIQTQVTCKYINEFILICGHSSKTDDAKVLCKTALSWFVLADSNIGTEGVLTAPEFNPSVIEAQLTIFELINLQVNSS